MAACLRVLAACPASLLAVTVHSPPAPGATLHVLQQVYADHNLTPMRILTRKPLVGIFLAMLTMNCHWCNQDFG